MFYASIFVDGKCFHAKHEKAERTLSMLGEMLRLEGLSGKENCMLPLSFRPMDGVIYDHTPHQPIGVIYRETYNPDRFCF